MTGTSNFEFEEFSSSKINTLQSVEIINLLEEKYGTQNIFIGKNTYILTCSVDNLVLTLRNLKDEFGFMQLLDLCAVDVCNDKNNIHEFQLNYHLFL